MVLGEPMMQRDDRARGLQWRAVLSIIAVFGWLIFLIIWLFFLTAELEDAQNLAVLLVSLLILIAVLAITWVTWGLKHPALYPQAPGYGQYYQRPRWKVALGGATVIAWLAFIVVWLFFYASEFTLYQNLGAVLASLLVVGGINWAIGLFDR
jgi:hypothetical protein